ncbi:TELO2-interacting protein 1 [Tanacetum coccineum]
MLRSEAFVTVKGSYNTKAGALENFIKQSQIEIIELQHTVDEHRCALDLRCCLTGIFTASDALPKYALPPSEFAAHIYTLFPLVLLLEAAVECMSLTRDTVAEGAPPKISDAVAEGVLRCLEHLLIKCHVPSLNQALLKALCFSSNSSCQCEQLKSLPKLIHNKRFSQSSFPVHELDIDECLLAFLRSQSAAVTVGHWLSLLLKAADVEVARGHKGSSKICLEAFITLRVLVAKIGKVLHVSKTMISGAAGSMEAMDQALRALTEFLMIVLQDEANITSLDDSDIDLNMDKSPLSFLEELRHLKKQDHGQIVEKKSIQESSQSDVKKSLHVERTKDWITTASSHVNKLLSATFPHLCVHPAKRVRQGTMAAIQGLLTTCSRTLKESRLMLLECLCALVCDDDEEVSEAAQMFLESLFSSSGRHHLQRDFADIFNRLFEKLPEVVVGGEQSLSHSQKLLLLIYYYGPQLVKDHLLHSPMKATTIFENGKTASVESNAYEDPNSYKIQNEYDLPHMPPWFSYFGNQKLYQSLAGILILVSLSLVAGSRSEGNLSIIKDIPLSYLRKEYMNESWQSWYKRTNSGKLVRQASTAVCILNELVFGLSDQAVDNMESMFCNNIFGWDVSSKRDLQSQLIDSIDSILHEYLSLEIWNLPLEQSNVVMIEGIRIFNLSFKSDFVSSGFLHLSLYVLLDNLICSNLQIKCVSDAWQKLQRLQKLEACSLPIQAEACHKHVKSELSNLERKTMNRVDDGDHSSLEDDADKYKEQLKVVFFKLKESNRYIRMVGSISISCITASTLLLSSLKQTACLIALDIVEDGIVALAEVEESYKQESRTREVLIEALQSHPLHDLADTLDAENDGTDENGLLPAMNKIWLFLIACIRNRIPLVETEVRVAVLEMIAEISGNKNSAFKSVVTKLLLANVSKSKEAISSPPPVEDLLLLFQLVPPPSSPKSYLYVQYVHRSLELDRTRGDTRSRHQVTLEVMIQIQLSVVVAALVSVICVFFEIILVIDEESFDQL